MTFDPEQNRIPTGLLTDEELNALMATKHGHEIFSCARWTDCPNPEFTASFIYRAKPAPAPTIIVNGIEVPEPVREGMEEGQAYFAPDVYTEKLCYLNRWGGDTYDLMRLNRGLIHLTKAAAVEHAKAMLAPSIREDV